MMAWPSVRGRLFLTAKTSLDLLVFICCANHHNEFTKNPKSTIIMTGLNRMSVDRYQAINSSSGLESE